MEKNERTSKLIQYVVEGTKFHGNTSSHKEKIVIATSFSDAFKIASEEENFIVKSISLKDWKERI